MPTIRPKTANGTIFIEISRVLPRESVRPLLSLPESVQRVTLHILVDRPTMTAIIRMLSICPSRWEEIGLLGIMPDTASGMPSSEKQAGTPQDHAHPQSREQGDYDPDPRFFLTCSAGAISCTRPAIRPHLRPRG